MKDKSKKKQFNSPLLSKYKKAFDEDSSSRVFAPLAETYRKLGLIDEALKVLKIGIQNHPDYLLGLLTLAACYFDLKKHQLVYDTLFPQVSLHRDNIRLQKLFALSALEVEKKKDALDSFKSILFLNPKDEEIIKYVTDLEKELEAPLMEVTSISKEESDDDSWTAVNLSETADDNDDMWSIEVTPKIEQKEKESKPKKQKVIDFPSKEDIKSMDDSPLITHTLVDLYINQELYDKAIELLKKYHDLNPDDARTKERLEQLLSKTVKNSEGHTDLMKAFDEKIGKKDKNGLIREKYMNFLSLIKEKAEGQSLKN